MQSGRSTACLDSGNPEGNEEASNSCVPGQMLKNKKRKGEFSSFHRITESPLCYVWHQWQLGVPEGSVAASKRKQGKPWYCPQLWKILCQMVNAVADAWYIILCLLHADLSCHLQHHCGLTLLVAEFFVYFFSRCFIFCKIALYLPLLFMQNFYLHWLEKQNKTQSNLH